MKIKFLSALALGHTICQILNASIEYIIISKIVFLLYKDFQFCTPESKIELVCIMDFLGFLNVILLLVLTRTICISYNIGLPLDDISWRESIK